MKNILFIFFLLFLLSLSSCKDESIPPQPDSVLNLKLEDVSCTEAWITLTTTNLQLPTALNLLRDDNIFKTINLQTADTLLYIDSLFPNQTYNFQISGIGNSAFGIKSNVASATTLDTTSHNFTFETYEFGTFGSSVLYDVAIINENNIWAVGEIMIADTSVNGYTMYNAIHWNGIEWTLHRIMFYTFCGGQHQNAYPASSILTFGENEIWIAMKGSQIAKIEGSAQIATYCLPVSVNKLWGTNSQNIYAVGNNGNIAHYNGSQWRRIESGTSLNINDIWGDYNQKTKGWEILAVASRYGSSLEKEIISIKANSVEKLSAESVPLMEPLLSIWFESNRQYYVVGSGIYQKHLLNDSIWKHNLFNITTFATTSIRGENINDVVGVGAFGDLIHYNGASWKNDYQEPVLGNGSYTEVGIKGDLILAVGGNDSKAIILVGKR